MGLVFVQPTVLSYVQPGSISIQVSTTNVANPVGTVLIDFDCPTTSFHTSFILEIDEVFIYNYPTDVYGTCTISAESPFYSVPPPLNVSIVFQLYFENVPEQLYVGQNFNLTIASTGNPPNSLLATLILSCSSEDPLLWYDVPLNILQQFELPNTLSPSDDCFFMTETTSYFSQQSVRLSRYQMFNWYLRSHQRARHIIKLKVFQLK